MAVDFYEVGDEQAPADESQGVAFYPAEDVSRGINLGLQTLGQALGPIYNPLVGAASEGARQEAQQERAQAAQFSLQQAIGVPQSLMQTLQEGAEGSEMGRAEAEQERQQQIQRATAMAGGGTVALAPPIGGPLQQAGRLAFGAIADIPELTSRELGLGWELYPGEEPLRNIQAGLRFEPLPAERERAYLPPSLQAVQSGAAGLIESAPQVGLVTALTALGVPAPLAGSVAFGATPEGFDVKQGAIAAALPYVGKYSGEITSALAQKFGLSSAAAQQAFNMAGGAVGTASYLATISASEIAGLPPEQRKQAIIDAIANNIGMVALGVHGGETKGTDYAPQERLIEESRQREYQRAGQIGTTTETGGGYRAEPAARLEEKAQVPLEAGQRVPKLTRDEEGVAEVGRKAQPEVHKALDSLPTGSIVSDRLDRWWKKRSDGSWEHVGVNGETMPEGVRPDSDLDKENQDTLAGAKVERVGTGEAKRTTTTAKGGLNIIDPLRSLTEEQRQHLTDTAQQLGLSGNINIINHFFLDRNHNPLERTVAQADLPKTDANGNFISPGRIRFSKPAMDALFEHMDRNNFTPEERTKLIAAELSEEIKHSVTTKKDAEAYHDSMTPAERWLRRRAYEGSNRLDLNKDQLGAEFLRQDWQMLDGLTPTEIAEHKGIKRLTPQALLTIARIIQRMREWYKGGTEAAKAGRSIMQATIDRMTKNVEAAGKAIGMEESPFEAARASVSRVTGKPDGEEDLPELIPGERLVTVQRPDGSTYTASFGDKYWELGGKRLASIAKPVAGNWSHGILKPGETIIERPEGEARASVRRGKTEEEDPTKRKEIVPSDVFQTKRVTLRGTTEETKQPVYNDLSYAHNLGPVALGKMLTADAGESGRKTVSETRRVTVLQNKETGQVEMVSTYRDGRRGPVMIDPDTGKSKKINELLPKYRPIASVLLQEPVKNFHQSFDNVRDYEGRFGKEARKASQPSMAPAPLVEGQTELPGVYASPEAITPLEAGSIRDHILAEVGRFDSPEDVKASWDALHEDSKPLVLNAYRKLAEQLERVNPPGTSNEEILRQLQENLYETHKQSPTKEEWVRRTLGQGGPEAGETLPYEPGKATFYEAPSETPRATIRRADADQPRASIRRELEKTLRAVRVIGQRLAERPVRHQVDQYFDASDNMANIEGQRAGKNVSIGIDKAADLSGSAAIAAGFDQSRLPGMLANVAGKNADAELAIRTAMNNWPEAERVGRLGQAAFDNQLASENLAGIQTLASTDYLPGVYDTDLWMGRGRPYVLGKSTGGPSTRFRKGKTYATPFDAVADGYQPRTLRLSELVEHRVRQGERLINRRAFVDGMRNINSVSDGKPIVTDMITRSRGPGLPSFEIAPTGYVPREIVPGTPKVAVHEDFAKLIDALNGNSKIGEFEPGGIPVGEMALAIAGGIKHGLLVFDTFHASRIMQKQMFLKRGLPSWKRGQSLLEYNVADLNRAVQAGEITPEIADWVRQNKPTAELLIRNGYNVGRIQENLQSSLIRDLPIVGTFNRWVFEKMSRGAMLEGGLIEFDRIKKANPNLSDNAIALKVARDLNAYFGNLGRQGIFKSATFQDAARLAFLAPQWVEAMARSEIGGAAQLAKAPLDSVRSKRLMVGSLGTGLGQGLLAYMVGTQILNLITRQQFTWQNPEKEHKMDAWIPDVTGKTGGFFISPLSVPAELTHDMIRYMHKGKNLLAAANQIRQNRSSPLWRAGSIIATGRDWNDQKIVGSWNRIKHAAWALAPTPIPLQPVVKGGQPGQLQRQLMGSAGIKAEPVGTPQAQVFDLARDWMSKSTDKKTLHKYDLAQKQDFGESDYKPLRQALHAGDTKAAGKAYQQLLDEGKSIKTIFQTMRPWTDTQLGGQTFTHYKPVAGLSAKENNRFINSLTPEQKQVLDKARAEQAETWKRFLEMLQKADNQAPQAVPQ